MLSNLPKVTQSRDSETDLLIPKLSIFYLSYLMAFFWERGGSCGRCEKCLSLDSFGLNSVLILPEVYLR